MKLWNLLRRGTNSLQIANEKILVSLIIIAYNVEEFIGKCIETTVNQTYQNLEIIVIDDHSPDNSGKIADEIAREDSRIKVFHHETNQGASASRNTGLDNSNGDFIVFVDGDDYLAEDFVEYMLGIQQQTGAELCLSMNNFTTKDMNQIAKDKVTILNSEETVAELLYPRIRMGVWNKLWKREFINKHKLRFIPGQPSAEGLIFMTNAAQYINCAGVGLRKVYYYRLNNENSATTKANVEKQGMASLRAMEIIKKNLDLSSNTIKNAMDYQYWGTSTYALRQIIDSGSKKQYLDLYNELVKYIRKNSLKMLNPNMKLPIRMRLIAIFRCINPVLITKLSLYLRNRHLKNS